MKILNVNPSAQVLEKSRTCTLCVDSGDIFFGATFAKGFLISKDGGVLTANHFIQPGKKIGVMSSDEHVPPEDIICTDQVKEIHRSTKYDLALLYLEEERDLPYKHFAFSLEQPDPGQVGYYYGLKELKSGEIVCNKWLGGQLKLSSPAPKERVYFKSDVIEGDSGTPLFDNGGEVIGVVAGNIDTQRSKKELPKLSLGFAYGIYQVREFMKEVDINIEDLLAGKEIRSFNKVQRLLDK